MDALHFDTFGVAPVDDLSDTSVFCQSEPYSYCAPPNKFLCRKCKTRKPGTPLCWKCWIASAQYRLKHFNETNKSTLELALACRAQTVLSLPSSKENGEGKSPIAPAWNGSINETLSSPVSKNQEEGVIKEPQAADVHWDGDSVEDLSCMLECDCQYCPHLATYEDGFWNEGSLNGNCCDCCDCCCSEIHCYCSLQNKHNATNNSSNDDNNDSDEAIEIEVDLGRVLCAVSRWLSVKTRQIVDAVRKSYSRPCSPSVMASEADKQHVMH
ncbi:hypothetical protein F5B21DRAFT_529068 [Xylaria acuta]|nr:hypothetical protein F5B21DRAFT_529068 [Xylaria acuta]